MRDQK
jgi:hypothetical protein